MALICLNSHINNCFRVEAEQAEAEALAKAKAETEALAKAKAEADAAEAEAAALAAAEEKARFVHLRFILHTVAINELLCMKNAGAQIAMDFS